MRGYGRGLGAACVSRWNCALVIDIITRGPESVGLVASLVIGLAWLAASVALGAGYRVRAAASVLIGLAVVVAVVSRLAMYNQHLYLIASICLILVINQAVPALLRAQLSIAYGFAAVTKINGAFLSGTVIYASAVQRPFWESFIPFEPTVALLMAISVFAILAESFLAVAFWFRRMRWVALVVGLGFHVGMLVVMSEEASSFLRLAVFGFLMVALYIPFFGEELDRRFGGRPTIAKKNWMLAPAVH